ncbi:uncharacterized protein RJT20DRAFT_146576 [Scheffersomyces xylosifermentans]|uniref:uncharacterized protein n=1 Tax=Scheffersomyces xylosifermentans TaxID=1304137 RepID=UPI00315DC61B
MATEKEKVKQETNRVKSNAFIEVLKSADEKSFASYKYAKNLDKAELLSDSDIKEGTPSIDHIPVVADTISHLKLLKAFSVLRKQIVGNNQDGYAMKTWQVFVTNATRRFVVFITALKKYLGEAPVRITEEKKLFDKGFTRNDRVIAIIDSLLPPLDVLMVWHAFLLNPRSFYDNMMRNDMFSFANFPLPLKKIQESISNETFQYNPRQELKDNYLEVIRGFSDDPVDSIYEFETYSMFEALVSVCCPICKRVILRNIPYTNDTNTGFADDSFTQMTNTNECNCDFPKKITHEELRKRQLYYDMTRAVPLPGVYRYYSGKIGGRDIRTRRDPDIVNVMVKGKFVKWSLGKIRTNSLESTISSSINRPRNFYLHMKVLLRLYFSMNLIYLNVAKGLPIYEDLVGCVFRQERFVEKMNDLDWLHSPVIKESLAESTIRYSRFFKMLTVFYPNNMLVPTLDIDLIWHTHQLSLHNYFMDCMNSKVGYVVDHDDKVETIKLDLSFETTSKLYRAKFKQDYSICFCWYCVSARNKAQPVLKGFFKSKKKSESEEESFKSSPLFVNSLGLTHISVHNAITIPNTYAAKRAELLEKKYKNKRDGDLPWMEGSVVTQSYYPYLFVVPPLYVGYGLGSCQDYYSATCTGIGDTSGNNLSGACGNSSVCGTGGCGGGPGACGGASGGCGGAGGCGGGGGGCGGGGGN